jgi:hypothetical protein
MCWLEKRITGAQAKRFANTLKAQTTCVRILMQGVFIRDWFVIAR